MDNLPIKLFSARSRFFTAARFPKATREEDDSDLAFVLTLTATVEKMVNLNENRPTISGDKEGAWPSVAEYYGLNDIIGVGSYTYVYSAYCKPRSEKCAVKIVDLKEWSPDDLDSLLKEVSSMSNFNHENVTRYYSTFVDTEELWIVMRLMENGSLLDVIRRKRKSGKCKFFDEDAIATIMMEIISGLTFLHDRGYIHKDIKAENILIASDGSVKIGEFCVTNWISKTRKYVGSYNWLAPEIIDDPDRNYTSKADVWSLGITAIEIATGSPPYHKCFPMKVLLMTTLNHPPTLDTNADSPDQYERYGKIFRSFIAYCLRKDPSKRPRAQELPFHRFLEKRRDKKYLRNILAEIPLIQDPVKVQKVYNEEEPLKNRRKWILTEDELKDISLATENSPGEGSEYVKTLNRASCASRYALWLSHDDRSSKSSKSCIGGIARRVPRGQINHIILRIRVVDLDPPMVLKTGIRDQRELINVAFFYDTRFDTISSVANDLVRDGLIDPKDRQPVMANLKALLNMPFKADGEPPSITFQLNSDILEDEELSEWNLVGFALLILKSSEQISSSISIGGS